VKATKNAVVIRSVHNARVPMPSAAKKEALALIRSTKKQRTTPEERRGLAKRLAVEHQHTTPSGKVGLCTCRACDDLRRAAAALCEDADMGQRASDELLRACEAEQERDEPRERLAAVEVVAEFIASEVGYWSPGMAEQARELIDALEAAGWQIVAGDAVVIPRDAIPDDLPDDLLEMAEEVSECRRVFGDHDRLVTAARLLSGATTEGDER